MAVSMFVCGRCGKRYSNPLTHTCLIRADRPRRRTRTRLSPQASRTCPQCGKPYANPLTHTCTIRTDYRKRKAAADRARKRAKTAEEKARKRAAAKAKAADARAKQRAATKAAVARAVARERERAAKRAAPAKPGGTGRPADRHDYRECFYASQPEQASLARQDCPRFPCRVFREGHELGWRHGYQRGYAKGHADGYAKGYPDGIRDCPRPHGNR